jgi:hypothetical protein
MYLNYYRLIRAALRQYESARMERLSASGWKDELHLEIRAAALECAAGPGGFTPALAWGKANYIKKNFLDVVLGKRSWRRLKRPASLTLADSNKIQCIETLYLCGGASAVYKYLHPTGEHYPREISKLCSLAFGYRPKYRQKKDPNTIRYTAERKKFNELLAEGFSVRTTANGSIYMQKGERKIRFSNHAGIDILQRDIAEFFYVGHVPQQETAA